VGNAAAAEHWGTTNVEGGGLLELLPQLANDPKRKAQKTITLTILTIFMASPFNGDAKY
jgi:hypothetical protein